MLEFARAGEWLAYLTSCSSSNVVSAECSAHWANAVLAGFVVALLILMFAGREFFRARRENGRERTKLHDRDIAVAEKRVDNRDRENGEGLVQLLAAKYRSAFKHSGLELAGWRIHDDG